MGSLAVRNDSNDISNQFVGEGEDGGESNLLKETARELASNGEGDVVGRSAHVLVRVQA